MQLLTNSRLRVYRECERKHDIMYRQRIRPVREAEVLRFGALIHLGLEEWWRGRGLEAALRAIQAGRDPLTLTAAQPAAEPADTAGGPRTGEAPGPAGH